MRRVRVLVQREMESGRAPLASISPIPRGHFDELAAQGGQCTRGCVRDRVGLANGKYCANYTPMLSEQSACRMISRSSFPDRELLVDFARYVLAERGAMSQRSAVADSLAQ